MSSRRDCEELVQDVAALRTKRRRDVLKESAVDVRPLALGRPPYRGKSGELKVLPDEFFNAHID